LARCQKKKKGKKIFLKVDRKGQEKTMGGEGTKKEKNPGAASRRQERKREESWPGNTQRLRLGPPGARPEVRLKGGRFFVKGQLKKCGHKGEMIRANPGFEEFEESQR